MIIKQQEGSFLLEFLIALAIFSIAIVGLVKLQNRSTSDLGDLGSAMAIPIILDDFTSRINLSQSGELSAAAKSELEKTAQAMFKTVSVASNKITITDIEDPSKKNEFEVVLDNSRIMPSADPKP